MMINKKILMSAAIAGMMFTAAPHAQAQPNSQAPAGQQAVTQTSFSDAKIEAYVESAIAVSKVHMDMAPQIQAAASEQEKERVYGEMQQQMINIIQQTDGITVQDYNNISQAAQQDQQLAMTIRTELEEAQQAVDGR